MPNFENIALRLTAASLWSSVTYACDCTSRTEMCSCPVPDYVAALYLNVGTGWDVLKNDGTQAEVPITYLSEDEKIETDKLAQNAIRLAEEQLKCHGGVEEAGESCSKVMQALRSRAVVDSAANWAYQYYPLAARYDMVAVAARISVRVDVVGGGSNPTDKNEDASTPAFPAIIALWWTATHDYLEDDVQCDGGIIGTNVFMPATEGDFIALFQLLEAPPDENTTCTEFETFIRVMDAISDWVLAQVDGDGDPTTLAYLNHDSGAIAAELSPFPIYLSLSRMTLVLP